MAKKRRDEGVDAAASDEESGPERTCAVTREKAAPEAMLRFVLGPDQQVVPDIKRRLPGRGVWIGLSRERVAQAVKKQVFARGLKDKAFAAPDLPELVENLLRRDALQALSLANKAGLVTTGFVKVEKAIEAGDVGGLLHARDGAADGKRKLGQALRRRHGVEGRPESVCSRPMNSTRRLAAAMSSTLRSETARPRRFCSPLAADLRYIAAIRKRKSPRAGKRVRRSSSGGAAARTKTPKR